MDSQNNNGITPEGNTNLQNNNVGTPTPAVNVPPVNEAPASAPKPDLNSILNGSEVSAPVPETPVAPTPVTPEPAPNPVPPVEAVVPPVVEPVAAPAPAANIPPVSEAPVVNPVPNGPVATPEVAAPVPETPTVQPEVPTPVVENPVTVNPVDTPVSPTVESIPVAPTTPVAEQAPVAGVAPVPEVNAAPVMESIPVTPEVKPEETPVVNPVPETPQVPNETINNNVPGDNNGVPSMDAMNNPAPNVVPGVPVMENMNPTPMAPQDDFNAVPVPPVFEEPAKEKKELKVDKKVIIIILVVVLIAAIGFGIYYFLSSSKKGAKSASIVTEDLLWELGEPLSQNIDDYAKITGINKSSCTLDVGDVDVTRAGAYKYFITCGSTKKDGSIRVDDTAGPVIVTNDVTVLPNATVKAEDFIEQCTDVSGCEYKFVDDIKNLTSDLGEKEVKIIATDDYNNETTVTAKLIVSNNAPVKYLTCTAEEKEVDGAKLVDTYKIGVDSNSNIYNAKRISTFTYSNTSSFENAKASYDKQKGINDITGNESFNTSSNTITIKSDKTLADIEKDVNGTLSDNANLLSIFMIGYGYTCK